MWEDYDREIWRLARLDARALCAKHVKVSVLLTVLMGLGSVVAQIIVDGRVDRDTASAGVIGTGLGWLLAIVGALAWARYRAPARLARDLVAKRKEAEEERDDALQALKGQPAPAPRPDMLPGLATLWDSTEIVRELLRRGADEAPSAASSLCESAVEFLNTSGYRKQAVRIETAAGLVDLAILTKQDLTPRLRRATEAVDAVRLAVMDLRREVENGIVQSSALEP